MLVKRLCQLHVALVCSAATALAFAESVERCMSSYEQGQVLRKQSRLLEALADFRECSQRECPALARADCVSWVREIEEVIPSIVVIVRTQSGRDVREAQVSIDGKGHPAWSPTTPIELDPGEHHIEVRVPEQQPIVTPVVVALAEKNRPVYVTVPDRSPPGSLLAPSRDDVARATPLAGTPSAAVLAPPRDDATRPSPLTWMVGGTSAALLVGGIALDLFAHRDLTELRDSCAPGCAPSDVEGIKTRMIVGDSLIAAGVLGGVATLVMLLSDSSGDVVGARPRAGAATAPAWGIGAPLPEWRFSW